MKNILRSRTLSATFIFLLLAGLFSCSNAFAAETASTSGGISVSIADSSPTPDCDLSEYKAPPFAGIEKVDVDIQEIIDSYKFDRSASLDIQISEEKDMGPYTKIFFSYASPNGGRVPAVLFMPKDRIEPFKPDRSSIEGTYPVVFFMHFHVADKSLADLFSTWPGRGLAVLAIDGVFRGERHEDGKDILMPDPNESAANMRLQIKDILRGFDVAMNWEGLDPKRVGYLGVSMGALTGTVATAMDSRIKTIVIADGAADFSLMFENSDYGSLQEIKRYMEEKGQTREEFIDAFKYVEPALFAPMITQRPVLLVNGNEDTTMSMPAMEKLHELVGTKKLMSIWYDSGHILPPEKLVVDCLKWYKKTL